MESSQPGCQSTYWIQHYYEYSVVNTVNIKTLPLSPLIVSAARVGHCRVPENQSFHWLAEGPEAVLPLSACHQVGNAAFCMRQNLFPFLHDHLDMNKPLTTTLRFSFLLFLRDESQLKASFMQNMIEDRTESALSYYEFLLHLQQQISK